MPGRKSLFSDVAGGQRRRPGGSDTDLDITPMIDVTFLLLIFFMVSSTMQGTPDFDIPVAKHGVGLGTKSATIISIRAADRGAAPTIHLGDVAGNPPEGTLDNVRRYVEEGLEENRRSVIIKAEGDVPHGFVLEVERAIAAIEGVEFNIGVQDKPSE